MKPVSQGSFIAIKIDQKHCGVRFYGRRLFFHCAGFFQKQAQKIRRQKPADSIVFCFDYSASSAFSSAAGQPSQSSASHSSQSTTSNSISSPQLGQLIGPESSCRSPHNNTLLHRHRRRGSNRTHRHLHLRKNPAQDNRDPRR